ncbi:glycosyltransferase family 2 protein [Sphingomonas sp. M1-B02]|uniref:glycosyltransferase family 2 protein n=1 Tax=Sphingomonas sp. M1-B02 TaxID=3114300 RepID=UPI0022409907|nr:glycosyltransferase family 2 protein [Sphingomonas sp. S6-11]UZK67729.1 glycosyltransferase family 2 protein [Sphingomonas sp. S6-11]
MLIASVGWAVAVLLGAPLTIYSTEMIAGLRRARPSKAGDSPPPASVAILIPAHNEAAGIYAMLVELTKSAPASARLVVIADNCSDDTASEARRAGATVVERHDTERRGKGHALSFGRDYLTATPPDVVLVIDADCRITPGTVEKLAAAAHKSQQPVQCVNVLEPDRDAPPLVQISSFALLVKNVVRARGMRRLGGTALLTGTGMAFPWAVFRGSELATGNIVEDLALGIELVRRGYRVGLVSDASVRSASAHVDDLLDQRRRWEQGFFQTARRWALPTLAHGISTPSRASLILGLHLMVPPLVSLFLAAFAGIFLLLVLAVAGQGMGPVLALIGLMALASLVTLVAWAREGRATLTTRALLLAPRYLLWKIPMYLNMLRTRPPQWIRTRRRP